MVAPPYGCSTVVLVIGLIGFTCPAMSGPASRAFDRVRERALGCFSRQHHGPDHPLPAHTHRHQPGLLFDMGKAMRTWGGGPVWAWVCQDVLLMLRLMMPPRTS